MYVRSFNEYLDDVDALLARVRERHGGATPWLMGHSMGGTVVTLAAVTRRPNVHGLHPERCGAGCGGTPRLVTRVMLLLGRFAPRLRVRKLAAATVSRDPEVVAWYDADPLNFAARCPPGSSRR